MASATVLSRAPLLPGFDNRSISSNIALPSTNPKDQHEDEKSMNLLAADLAARFKKASLILQDISDISIDLDEYSNDLDSLQELPVSRLRIDEDILAAPRRKTSSPIKKLLAESISNLLYPAPEGSLAPIIRYEQDRIRFRNWILLQRKYDIAVNALRGQRERLVDRLAAQGPWDPEKKPISLDGPPALPMPVEISDAVSLDPFFRHLKQNGNADLSTLNPDLTTSANQFEENHYGTTALEFPKGVVYADARMDLCKMVVGPPNIGPLMASLKSNTFIKHFLLGNNIIGPIGARHIADFVNEYPDRMDTWYLAGNCIEGPSFSTLVDALITSPAVTNIWLKRNPLGSSATNDVFRLITQTPNLRTLDLDQTNLGDAGVANLFNHLSEHGQKTPLEIIYMNGNGIGVSGAKAIGRYLASDHCNITSIYMSNNPLGSKGAAALASGLKTNRSLTRLTLQSVGLTDAGAILLFTSLQEHPHIKLLDVGMSIATVDLGQAYNYLTDAIAPHLADLVTSAKALQYIRLDTCALTIPGLNIVLKAMSTSISILLFRASSIFPAGRDYNSVKAGQEHARLHKLLGTQIIANIRAKYGNDMTYEKWISNEKRWVVSDEQDVRKIDSVYRNRDMDLARRGTKKLDKWWSKGDETLAKVANYPYCKMGT